jgi:sugar/nucleoside kinase (ribokinase family)
MRAALVAGHVCVDLMPGLAEPPHAAPGELIEVGPLSVTAGGCVANTASGLAALGAEVHVVADAGADTLGETLVRLLRARGLGTEQIRLLDGCSTSYSVVLQPPGQDRSFWHHIGANAEFDGSGVDLAGAGLLHVGYPSLLPALAADGGATLQALLARAREAGITTSLDLAVLDPTSPAAALDWARMLAGVLPLVDVLTPSIDDLESCLHLGFAHDRAALRRAARMMVEMGAGVAMVTAGAEGLQLCTADGHEHFMPAPRVEVRTTLGAGDAATAGLLYGLLDDGDPDRALHLAAQTAAQCVSGRPIRRATPA